MPPRETTLEEENKEAHPVDSSTSPTTTTTKSTTNENKRTYREQVLALYHAQVPTNTDLDDTRHERLFRVTFLRRYVLPLLADERDFIAVELFVNMIVVLIPLFVAFCWYPSHVLGILFLVLRLKWLGQRFMLTLHIVSHRKLFREDNNNLCWLLLGKVLNQFPETILAMAMGLPPGGYYIHHVMMHHCENNLFPYDVTSTMPFQRDTNWGLIQYVSLYFTVGVFYLPYYAWRKRRYGRLAAHILWMLLYYVWLPFGWVASSYPLHVTYWVVLPYLVLGWYIMMGNFSQHLLVCPKDFRNNYKLCYMIVNCPQSKYNYNDGYHLTHHLNSRLHWSELPTHFLDNIELFAKNDALIFKDIDTKQVMNLIFQKDYATLYTFYVQIRPHHHRSQDDFASMIRQRVMPIPINACYNNNHNSKIE